MGRRGRKGGSGVKPEEGQGDVVPVASEVASYCSFSWSIQDCHITSV